MDCAGVSKERPSLAAGHYLRRDSPEPHAGSKHHSRAGSDIPTVLFGQKLLQFKAARGAPISQGINPYCRIHKRSRTGAVTAHEKDKINS